MERNISKMDLEELDRLQSIVKEVNERYAKRLTTYSVVNNDAYFKNMSIEEQALFTKKKKLGDLLERINYKIEEKIFDSYVK